MTDLPAYPDSGGHTGDDAGGMPDRGSPTTYPRTYPGTPRWVKVSGIVVVVLVLLVVIIVVTGVGGQHGPARHIPSGGAGGHTPPIAQGAQRP